MKKIFLLLITSTVLFLGACTKENSIPEPCDEDFVGPLEEGQCE